ncbi:hypothetical protein GQ44DRAFT_731915 [Phaeosphaeriaceae sp. PMI808]|nr:hypothetical protein GQ44DRAFT_731915 [Phaeosphaeriaceae sp. PMI808]
MCGPGYINAIVTRYTGADNWFSCITQSVHARLDHANYVFFYYATARTPPTKECAPAIASSNTTQVSTSSTTGQPPTQPQTLEEEDKRTTSHTNIMQLRVVYTTAYFIRDQETQIMYILDFDTPHGRTLRQHRGEWTAEKQARFIRQHATSTRAPPDEEEKN